MVSAMVRIAQAATRLAERLPQSVVIALAESVVRHGCLGYPEAKAAILQSLPTPDFRDVSGDFLDLCVASGGGVTPEAVASALVTAASADAVYRQQETVEIVWTGPETSDTRSRRTEQAILEVLDSARDRLTVVSYAVYRIPRIGEALVAAASRGVRLRLIVETPNRIEGQGEYDCLRALGNAVESAAAVYYWPQEKRTQDETSGKFGILHVKCAVADGNRLFLSSANLTDYAFTINMELGLLVTGGKLPGQVERIFDALIETGHLSRV